MRVRSYYYFRLQAEAKREIKRLGEIKGQKGGKRERMEVECTGVKGFRGGITNNKLKLSELIMSREAHGGKIGGVVLFSGEVRLDIDRDGVEVDYLYYDTNKEHAELKIEEVVNEAIKRWGLRYGYCIHRVGRIEVGESAIVIITSGGHRGQAYESSRYILDRVKKEAAIWKKEVYKDGSHRWG